MPQVVAIVLAGSQTTRVADESSDFDFYMYVEEEIPVDIREAIARQFSDRIEINNQFWEPGDEWIDINTGCGIDIMYRRPEWIEEELDRSRPGQTSSMSRLFNLFLVERSHLSIIV